MSKIFVLPIQEYQTPRIPPVNPIISVESGRQDLAMNASGSTPDTSMCLLRRYDHVVASIGKRMAVQYTLNAENQLA